MEPLIRYFEGERQAGLLCAALGAASLGAALWAWRHGDAFRWAMVPLLAVGLVQLGVGVGLTLRTPPQVAALERDLASGAADAPAARARELARMERVSKSFRLIEAAEVALLVAGAVVTLALRERATWVGIAMALCIEAAVMLAFDVFAEERAHAYLRWLSGAA